MSRASHRLQIKQAIEASKQEKPQHSDQELEETITPSDNNNGADPKQPLPKMGSKKRKRTAGVPVKETRMEYVDDEAIGDQDLEDSDDEDRHGPGKRNGRLRKKGEGKGKHARGSPIGSSGIKTESDPDSQSSAVSHLKVAEASESRSGSQADKTRAIPKKQLKDDKEDEKSKLLANLQKTEVPLESLQSTGLGKNRARKPQASPRGRSASPKRDVPSWVPPPPPPPPPPSEKTIVWQAPTKALVANTIRDRIVADLDGICKSVIRRNRFVPDRKVKTVDLSGSFLREEDKLDFFDHNTRGEIVLQPKVPIFPEEFPPGMKEHSLAWWGILDPALGDGKYRPPPVVQDPRAAAFRQHGVTPQHEGQPRLVSSARDMPHGIPGSLGGGSQPTMPVQPPPGNWRGPDRPPGPETGPPNWRDRPRPFGPGVQFRNEPSGRPNFPPRQFGPR